MANIKKTYEEAVSYLETLVGKPFTKQAFDKFVEEFATAKSQSSGGQREFVKLFDKNGEMIGRKCSVTGKWFSAEHFSKNTSVIKSVDHIRAKFYNESKAMEKEALALVEKAREAANPQEKLKLFEEYDKALQEAKEHRAKEVPLNDEKIVEEMKDGFDSVEELAKELGAEVILETPKKD